MAILNLKYKKINAENIIVEKVSSVKVNYSFKLFSCEEFKPKINNPNEGFLKIVLSLSIGYEKIGKIDLIAEILYAAPKKIIEECLSEYKKSKNLPKTILEEVNTYSFRKMISKAFSICEDLELPTPYPLPKIQINKKDKK